MADTSTAAAANESEDLGVKLYAVTKTVKVEAENITEAAKIARYMRVPKRDNITVIETSDAVIEIDEDDLN